MSQPTVDVDQHREPETTDTATFPEASPFEAIYDRDGPHTFGLHSRYVFHDDGRFSLQYMRADSVSFEYPGAYTVSGSEVGFEFDGWSVAGPWEATGTLDGDELRVEYNIVMMLSDFDNGLYLLSEGDPPE